MLRGAPGTRALTAAGDELAGSVCIEVSPLGHPFGAPPNPTGACSLNLPHWGVSGAQEQFQVQSVFPGAFRGTLLERTLERLTKEAEGSTSHLCRLDGGAQMQLVRRLSCRPTSLSRPIHVLPLAAGTNHPQTEGFNMSQQRKIILTILEVRSPRGVCWAAFPGEALGVSWAFPPSRGFPGASLVVQLVKNPPAMQETRIRSLGREDSRENPDTT